MNLYICDKEWNLLEEKVLLKDTGVSSISKMDIGFQGDSLWVKFDGIPSTNIVWFSSTFLVTFDSDFGLKNYYRNGDVDTHYCGNILSLDRDRFFLGSTVTYKILQRISCDQLGKSHNEVVDEAVAPTHTKEGLTEGSHCSVCNKVLKKQEKIEALGYDNSFTDVNTTDFFYTPVVWAQKNNITTGVGNNQFAPDQACSRAQVVTFLWRANSSPEPATQVNPFTDVSRDAYYFKAILWAVENGITAGYGSDTIFNPDGACTRAQVATFMWRAAGNPDIRGAVNPFIDLEAGGFYYDAVLWAVESGITNGYGSDTIFNPDGICTRGQIVTFLYRGMN